MSFLIAFAALGFLMLAAYRGYSVTLLAPPRGARFGAVDGPGAIAPLFSGIFAEKMVGFVKLYFLVFLLSAVFGMRVELAGFCEPIVMPAIPHIGRVAAYRFLL